MSRAIYAARANLALTPPNIASALAAIQPALALNEQPTSVRAVKSFAEYLDNESERASKLDELRDLVLEYDADEVNEETREDERVVRALAGTAFMISKEIEEAVTTLSEGCGKTDLEW